MIDVLLADDHPLIRDGLHATLEGHPSVRLVGVAATGREALDVVADHAVDVVLMDVDMPEMDGLEATRRLRAEQPEVKVIVLTMHDEPALMQRLIREGVHGYVLKSAGTDEIVRAVKQVCAGTSYFSPEVTVKLAAAPDVPAPAEALTEREMEVLKLVAQGLSNKEVGERLFISHRTVDTHRTNLMRKLDVNNVAGLVRYAFQHDLVS